MAEQNEYLAIMEEIKSDIVDVVKDLINEEVMPLLKERQRIEKAIGNKEINELLKLEQEAR